MTQLTEIRHELRSLAARRRRARLVDALLLGGAMVVLALGAYFWLDRRFTLAVGSRAFLNGVLLLGLGWFAVRKLWPAWHRHEDAVDTALRFEHRRGIDADLTAALEFEPALVGGGDDEYSSDGETRYGSRSMTGAVVERVARDGRQWNFADEPVDAASRGRRLAGVAVVALGVAAVVVAPQFAQVFLQRVLLASPHYPSAVKIDGLTVNESAVTYGPDAPATIVPLGGSVAFALQLSGEVPEQAVVELTGSSGETTPLELARSESPGDERRVNEFRGVLPAAIEDLVGRVVAGDAYTDAFRLRVVPLPAAVVTLEVHPPAYAAEAALDVPPPGRLHASVLEGSDVAIQLVGANKRLTRAELTHGDDVYPLTAVDDGRTWRLDPTGTEFAAVARPIEFVIDVVDVDGFRLPDALRGSIALRADQPPSVSADVVTKFVLPEGRPTIFFHATDDLGVESLSIDRQVQRLDGTLTNDTVPVPIPLGEMRTDLSGKVPLDLTSLQLHKGERVTIRLTARDRRGDDPRATAQSEPFVLEVTDEQGLYEAMAETDQRSALKMDEIIQKQLMMTGRPSSPGLPPAPQNVPPIAPSPVPKSTTP